MAEARALVTGASSGIGAAFARRLGARGRRLVLTARRAERLRELQRELGGEEVVAVVQADLAAADGPRHVVARIAELGIEVDLLVNNAGLGHVGPFHAEPHERVIGMVDVNVRAMVALTHLLLPQMIARRSGAILNVASTAAFQPIPYFATYAASKAFAMSFTDALAVELRGSGVAVQLLCPGPTETEFFDAANHAGIAANRLPRSSPELVAETALRALASGRERVIVGLGNALFARLARLAPMPLARAFAGRLYRSAGK